MLGWMLPWAELLALDKDLVTLQLNRPAPRQVFEALASVDGVRFRGCFRVLRPVEPREVTGRVLDLGFPVRQHVYCCQLKAPAEALDSLRVLLEPLAPVRDSKRVRLPLRVRSLWLPEYTALTRDLSLTGVGLVCHGPLEVGLHLPLRIDSEEGPFEVDAEVRWSQNSNSGARFEYIGPQAATALARLTAPVARPELTMLYPSERRLGAALAWG